MIISEEEQQLSDKKIKVPGKLSKKIFQEVAAGFLAIKELPEENTICSSELLEAEAGRRSLPNKDRHLMESIKRRLGHEVDTRTGDRFEGIGKWRTPTEIRHRLCIVMIFDGLPILVLPRPDQEFSLTYLIFCCSIYDKLNKSMWSEKPIVAKSFPGDDYLTKAWNLKLGAVEDLKLLGYNTKNKQMYNKALRLYHYNLQIIKYKRYIAKGMRSKKNYKLLIPKYEAKIAADINRLTALCYKAYQMDPLSVETPEEFVDAFKYMAELGILFDPFKMDYLVKDLEWLGIGNFWDDYVIAKVTMKKYYASEHAIRESLREKQKKKESLYDRLSPLDKLEIPVVPLQMTRLQDKKAVFARHTATKNAEVCSIAKRVPLNKVDSLLDKDGHLIVPAKKKLRATLGMIL